MLDLGVSKLPQRAIVTRNSPLAIEHMIGRFGRDPFHIKLSREFLPFKPDPASAKHIIKVLYPLLSF